MRQVDGEVDCQARCVGDYSRYTVLEEGETVGGYAVQLWRRAATHALVFNVSTKNQRLRGLFSRRDFRIAISLCFDRNEMRELL